MRTATEWKNALAAVARPEKVAILSGFFKTGKGEYGEGDVFIGVSVPDNRKVAKLAVGASWPVVEEMLDSPVHEHRLSALLALALRFPRADERERWQIVDFYLAHTAQINNWDLVDLSAPQIIGKQMLFCPEFDPTVALCGGGLWECRIGIVATMTLIRAGKFDVAIRNIERLLYHPHDLIRKANGWMLREIGKKDESALLAFLDCHAAAMPRTALRYAVERLSPEKRRHYMGQRQM